MSRGHDPKVPFPSRETDQGLPPSPERTAPNEGSVSSSRPREGRSHSREPRGIHEFRGHRYRLRPSEVEGMVELGKFRAIAQEDLIEFLYAGDKARFRPDLENLLRQGLALAKVIPYEPTGSRTLFTLTKQGHRFLLATHAAGKEQVVYHGFTRHSEAHHDADLYRLYQKASKEIERQGGKNLRVLLENEIKRRVNHDLAKLGEEQNSPECKREVAERHDLQMVREKIPVPDIRIEYETRDGENARIDLELATGNYRGRPLTEKIRAGFAVYAHGDEVSKLRRILDQRELTAEILSL